MEQMHGPLQGWIEVVQKKKIVKRIKGRDYLVAYPKRDKNRPPTVKLRLAQARFKQCINYATNITKDPGIKQAYLSSAKRNQSAQNRAFQDAAYPPKVEQILMNNYLGQRGATLSIRAVDDFEVTRVIVAIYYNEELIEQGEAVYQDYWNWEYSTQQDIAAIKGVRIVATAYDLPGNNHSLALAV